MDSLVGYGSDDENESERYGGHLSSVGGAAAAQRRRDDDTNYDDVNMDMSEDSQEAESEPELLPAEPAPARRASQERRGSGKSHDSFRGAKKTNGSRSRERSRDRNHSRESDRERKDRRRESPPRARSDRERHRDARDNRDNREPRRDDRHNRSDRNERGRGHEASQGSSRRGLLGDRPDERGADGKVPALMDLKPFGGEPPPVIERGASQDARDAVSPRFVDRDRRDRGDRGDRERDRDRHSRRSEEKRSSSHRHAERRSRSRSRSRGAAFPPPPSTSTSSSSAERGERRGSPSGDYRPSSYKVNKKLEVMEKMGLQIKTPDGSMATARQLRAAAGDAPRALPQYLAPGALATAKILDQVQKRKLLWASKRADAAASAPPPGAAQWSGARFAQDNDGRQASKFMRLMGIKDPAAVKPDKPASGDGMKKQEELFQAMQAQYDVARATTHTMRGVGLGFSRNQY